MWRISLFRSVFNGIRGSALLFCSNTELGQYICNMILTVYAIWDTIWWHPTHSCPANISHNTNVFITYPNEFRTLNWSVVRQFYENHYSIQLYCCGTALIEVITCFVSMLGELWNPINMDVVLFCDWWKHTQSISSTHCVVYGSVLWMYTNWMKNRSIKEWEISQ